MNKNLRKEVENVEGTIEESKLPELQIPISKELQSVLVDIAIQDYDRAKEYKYSKEYGLDDKGTSLKFKEWREALTKLYFGKREPKTVPWLFCSNRSMKITMAIVEMLHSRMYAATWNESLLRWRPGGVEDKDKVENINKLTGWWFRVKDYMGDFFDKWVKIAVCWGDVTTEVGWKIKKYDRGEVEEQEVMGEDGQPLINPDGTPAVTFEKRLHTEETTTHEIIGGDKIFLQPNCKSMEEDPVIIERDYIYSQLENMERRGVTVNISTTEKDYVDKKIQIPDNLDLRKEDIDRVKQVRRRNIDVNTITWFGHYDVDGDGFEEDIRLLVDPINKVYLGGVYVKDLTYDGKRPLDITKFNDRLDSVDGLEGLGLLEQVKELSEEVDACFNQFTDSNTLSIMRPGFYDPAGDVDAPTIKLAPNKITPVSNPQKNLYFPELTIDTTRLLNAIRLVLEFIERLTGASSYVMGKESEIVGGSGTATRTQAIMQSAEQRFSTPAQRLKAGASRVLTRLLDQIQKNIPEGMEQRILDDNNDPIFKPNDLSQEGISGKYDAYLLEDSTLGDKNTERQLTDLLYNVLIQNPLIMSDPAKLDKVTRDFVKAYTDKTKADELLGPEPPRSDTDSPEEENKLAMGGEFQKVKAILTENHIQHLFSHNTFLQDPMLATIPKTMAEQVVQFMQAHIQEHQMMLQQAMGMAQQAQQQMQGGQGGQIGQKGASTPIQGNVAGGGMATGGGPLGQVLNEKQQGESLQT